MLERMPNGDAVALITFDDEVRVEKPLTVLSKSSRTAIAKVVHAIRTGGSTNLAGGTPCRHPAAAGRHRHLQLQGGAAFGWVGQRG